jgi:hypothetical protein
MANWSKTRFFDAVRSWQAADVRAALRERPELATACDSSGRPPLHVCARRPLASPAKARASIATAEALLDAGAARRQEQPLSKPLPRCFECGTLSILPVLGHRVLEAGFAKRAPNVFAFRSVLTARDACIENLLLVGRSGRVPYVDFGLLP